LVAGLSRLVDAYSLAAEAAAFFAGILDKDKGAAIRAHASSVRESAAALREWAGEVQQVGRESILEGIFPTQQEIEKRVPPAAPADDQQRQQDQQQAATGIANATADAMANAKAALAELELAQSHAAHTGQMAALETKTNWTLALEAVTAQASAMGVSIAGIFGTIAHGGIASVARLAKAKVLENLAFAAENFAKSLGWIALGNVPSAAVAKAAAVGHLQAAGKWGLVLGASAGASDGGGGGPSAAAPNTRPAERSQPAGPEINIHFVGPGFDAVNPQVQQVVQGAITAATERQGGNARVRMHSRPR
jgi:hypothetical protein